MSQRTMHSHVALRWVLAALIALAPSVSWGGGNQHGFGFRSVGGVLIDAEGVVGEPTVKEMDLTRKRIMDEFKEAAADLAQPVELRMFSLRAAEEAMAKADAELAYQLPDEIKYMAGLQRIQYVFVYPEQKDVVLAGPGEGWKIDAKGNRVGVTTGRPVLRIEDFILAMRTVESARQGGISVSIDPTAEGRQRLDKLIGGVREFKPAILEAIEKALGPQVVSIRGIPETSHFARTLVASDYKMKRIAMKLQPSPVKGLTSYIDLLTTAPDNMMPRWWMACNYEPIAKSKDGLAWEIRGQGIKVMTEDELVNADGTVKGTGKANPAAQAWADQMTEKFDELAVKEPIFGELRNLFDFSVVAALIAKEDLLTKANCPLPTMADSASGLGVTSWVAPRFVDTQCGATKKGRNFIITASGGVEITSWQVADKTVESAEVEVVRSKATPKGTGLYW
ncbi:MAG TPA: DUF1598 domain-containing protein [Pirellulaceae bacterium]|nr:DUF1598 domain-containing protein [Pirellulaceae bacterium]